MTDLVRIEHIVFRRLGKTALDVLTNSSENARRTDITIPGDHTLIEGLVGHPLAWTEEGKSARTELQIAPVEGQDNYPAATLKVNHEHGKRNEIKLTRQRDDGLPQWVDPVRAERPPADESLILLIRDQNQLLHARFVRSMAALPELLQDRVARAGDSYGSIDFQREGGVALADPTLARVIEALRRRHNVLLYGPPGTGKTVLMTQVRQVFEKGVAPLAFDPGSLDEPFQLADAESLVGPDRPKRTTRFVTFHQGTSYETFVCGIRPVVAGGKMHYKVVAGPLLELASDAQAEDSAALLLIDELNRGNTAEIFGELVTVMEVDKRLDKDGNETPTTITPELPNPPDSSGAVKNGMLQMPWALFTLASMNSVDRSVAPLDSALRRRFEVIEVAPDLGLLRQKYRRVRDQLESPELSDEWGRVSWLAFRVLEEVNRRIAILRGDDFRLGHGFLWSVFAEDASTIEERTRLLLDIFGSLILPQLRELFRDFPEELRDILGGAANEGRLYTFDEGDGEIGSFMDAVGWLRFHQFPIEGDQSESLAALRAVARIEDDAERWPDEAATLADDEVEGDEVEGDEVEGDEAEGDEAEGDEVEGDIDAAEGAGADAAL